MKKYLMIVAMLVMTSAQVLAYTYPPAITAGLRRSFLSSGISPATANCVVAKVQKQYSFDEFTDEMLTLGAPDGVMSPAMKRLVMGCVIETQ